MCSSFQLLYRCYSQFLLYQDEVKKVELVEDVWEESLDDIPDELAVDFSVDTRTVIGTIENIQDGAYIVNTGRLAPTYIMVEHFPNLKWKFESGDVVRFLQPCKRMFVKKKLVYIFSYLS